MVFGRGKKAKQEQLTDTGDAGESDAVGTGAAAEAPDAAVRSAGPYDVSEIDDQDGYVDLGALLITPREGLQLRLEVEEATQRVVAVTMDLDGSSLQLQAFAAPRSEGLWDEIREQIGQSVGSQGGQVDEIEGHFGIELVAKLPAGRRQRGIPRGPVHRRRRPALVPPRRTRRGCRAGSRRRRRTRGAVPANRRGAGREPDAAARPSAAPASPGLRGRRAAGYPGLRAGCTGIRAARARAGDHPDWLMPLAGASRSRSGARPAGARTGALPRLHRVRDLRPGRRSRSLHCDHHGPRLPAAQGPSGAGQPRDAACYPAHTRTRGRRPAPRDLAGTAPDPRGQGGLELRLEGMVTIRDGLPTMFNPRYEILSRKEEQ